jgi:hypothetical protein
VPNGGCACGAVRYEAGGSPSHETICHCALCRRASGAPLVAWATFPSADLRLLQGVPATFRSSPRAVRSFCARCGTQLFFRSDGAPGEVDVTIASLDDPEGVRPRDHTFVGSRLSWIHLADGLLEHPAAREGA